MARNMNTNMYCFCCNESSTLEQILLSADDFRLARGECKKNLCTLNDCFTITYCNNCELYSIAVEDRLINGIFIYKLKTTKEKPSVICFLDDTTEKNAKSKKQLSEAIKTVLKRTPYPIINDIQYISYKNSKDLSSLCEILTCP